MRKIFFIMIVPLALSAADDANQLFRSCAYTLSLHKPGATGTAPLAVTLQAADTGDGPLPVGAVLDRIHGRGDKSQLIVTSQTDGFLYVVQDPPDPTALIIPDAKAPNDNRVAKGISRSFTLRATSGCGGTLIVGVSPEPIADIGHMSAGAVRHFFSARAHCGNYALQEKPLTGAHQ